MPICKLIHDEIQRISGLLVANLDPREYDKVMEQIPKEFEKLEILEKILGLSSKNLAKLDMLLLKLPNSMEITKLNKLFASKVEDITETTIIYHGEFECIEYEKLNPGAKSLPDNLKIIFGQFDGIRSTLEIIDLWHVEGISLIERSANLKEININSAVGGMVAQYCDSLVSINVNQPCAEFYLNYNQNLRGVNISNVHAELDVKNCNSLVNLIFGNVGSLVNLINNKNLIYLKMGNAMDDFQLQDSPLLTLENIQSQNGERIIINKNFIHPGSSFENLSEADINSKFDIRHSAI